MGIPVPEKMQHNPMLILDEYAPELARTYFAFNSAAYSNSRLSLREFEVARFMTAQLNGCQICKSFRAARDIGGHYEVAGQEGAAPQRTVADNGPPPDEALYANIRDWRTAPNYSDRERIIAEYAERIGTAPEELGYDEAYWKRARSLMRDDEIVDMAMCIAGWLGGGRTMHALGLDTVCFAGPLEQPVAA